eukprot:gene3117-2290_t
MSVKVTGDGQLGSDGYLIDFGDIKKVVRNICKGMNEFFICPMKSPELQITEEDGQVCIACPDGARFCFPSSDCAKLPVMHSSAEELSHYFWCEIVRKLGLEKLHERGIRILEVTVAEAPNQSAAYRAPVPATIEEFEITANSPVNVRPRFCASKADDDN